MCTYSLTISHSLTVLHRDWFFPPRGEVDRLKAELALEKRRRRLSEERERDKDAALVRADQTVQQLRLQVS